MLRRSGHLALALVCQVIYDAFLPLHQRHALVCGLLFSFSLWQMVLWSTVALLRCLDHNFHHGGEDWKSKLARHIPGQIGKLKAPSGHKEPSFERKLRVAVRNITMLSILIPLWYWTMPTSWFYTAPAYNLNSSFGWRFARTLLLTFRHFITADIFFYFGHLLMHKWKWLRSRVHKVHHSSFASCAIGGYYMDPVDFVLEHGAIFISWAIWREVGAEWMVSITTGAWNLLVTHSAWDLTWGPNPRQHFYHHNGGIKGAHSNFGIFLDEVFKTKYNPVNDFLCSPVVSSFSK